MFCEMFSFRSNYFSFILKKQWYWVVFERVGFECGLLLKLRGAITILFIPDFSKLYYLFVTIKANKNILYIILEVWIVTINKSIQWIMDEICSF